MQNDAQQDLMDVVETFERVQTREVKAFAYVVHGCTALAKLVDDQEEIRDSAMMVLALMTDDLARRLQLTDGELDEALNFARLLTNRAEKFGQTLGDDE